MRDFRCRGFKKSRPKQAIRTIFTDEKMAHHFRILPILLRYSFCLVLVYLIQSIDDRGLNFQPPAFAEEKLSGSSTVAYNNESNSLELDSLIDGGEIADDLDKLLDLADQDFTKISKVNVAAPSLNVEVTTVTRKKSTVGKSPAAIYVIDNERIRRSGARTIPDLLRMVPGVQVARINANVWAVSIRGNNGQFSDSLQVQIDGRSIYNALFGGVFWTAQDLVFEDIDRIEVIRGPGATVWGANSVNGIVNIITKNSAKTQGVYYQGGIGTRERGFSYGRYGGEITEGLTYRIYGTWFDRERGFSPSGFGHDDASLSTGGFRLDWSPDDCNELTLHGSFLDGYRGASGNFTLTAPPFSVFEISDYQLRGGNILGRWNHTIDQGNSWAFQVYYDEYDQQLQNTTQNLELQTIDLDFQHQIDLGDIHSVNYGFSYRISDVRLDPITFRLGTNPAKNQFQIFGGFIQDEINLLDDELSLILGIKLSSNNFSGFEYQPSARLLWTPTDTRTFWGSVSRAIVAPQVISKYLQLYQPPVSTAPVVFPAIVGIDNPVSEVLLAYEIGYREQPSEDISWDVALFFNQYDNSANLTNIGLSPNPFVPGTFLAAQLFNTDASQQAYGFEISSQAQMTDQWKMHAAYSFLVVDNDADNNGSSPRNQLYLQSSVDISDSLLFDITWRYVDNIKDSQIGSYNTMDARIEWRPNENFEWAIVGRQFLNSPHLEFADTNLGFGPTEVPGEVFTTLTWRFK